MPTKTATSPKSEKSKKTPANSTFTAPEVDSKAIAKQEGQLAERITALVVKDQESYNVAAKELTSVKQFITYLESLFAESKKALNAAVKKLREDEKRVIGQPLAYAQKLEQEIRGKMSKFLIAEEYRVRREEREKREAAELEAKKERERLEKQAAKAEEKGKEGKAEVLREQAKAVTVAPVQVESKVTLSGTGTSGKDDIAVEIVDPRLFLRFLLDSGADISTLVDFKYGKVKDYVKALPVLDGEIVQKAPGIKVEKKKIISSFS